MIGHVFRTIVLALVAFTPINLHAAEVTYHPNVEDRGYVAIDGKIEDGDADKFRKIAATQKVSNVFLSSEGGSLVEALEIGRIIHVSNYRTVVTSGDLCASSCALIWLAGNPRFAQENALIGFHASYTVEGGKTISNSVGNAMVGRYLTQMGLPASVVMFATSAEPDEMKWIDLTQRNDGGISYEIVPTSAEEDTKQVEEASEEIPSPTMLSKTKAELQAINGQEMGKWKILSDEGYVGMMTETTDNAARLALLCFKGKPCRFVIKMNLQCDPGDKYAIQYRVEGYPAKPMEMLCTMDKQTLFFGDSSEFGKAIANEMSVTILAENHKDDPIAYEFNLIGYIETAKYLLERGYIGFP